MKSHFITEGNSNRTHFSLCTHFSSCNTSQVLCLAFCNTRAQLETYFYVLSRNLRNTILKASRLEIFWASSSYYLKHNMVPFKEPWNLAQMMISHYYTGSQMLPARIPPHMVHLWLLASHWNTDRSKIHLCICSIPIYPASKGTRKKFEGRQRPGRLSHHLSAGNRHQGLTQLSLSTMYIVKLNWSHTFYSSV